MAKTNFSKVEQALKQGMQEITVSNLLGMTSPSTGGLTSPHELCAKQENKDLIALLNFELKYGKNPAIFTAGGTSRKELKDLLGRANSLNEDEWNLLRTLGENIESHKKSEMSKLSPEVDEKLIEEERKRHINKRYNTKERWLPLH